MNKKDRPTSYSNDITEARKKKTLPLFIASGPNKQTRNLCQRQQSIEFLMNYLMKRNMVDALKNYFDENLIDN